jgi:hypothetical protein
VVRFSAVPKVGDCGVEVSKTILDILRVRVEMVFHATVAGLRRGEMIVILLHAVEDRFCNVESLIDVNTVTRNLVEIDKKISIQRSLFLIAPNKISGSPYALILKFGNFFSHNGINPKWIAKFMGTDL